MEKSHKISKFRQELVDKMIEMLDSGELFWNSPVYTPEFPRNGITGKPYHKSNLVCLSLTSWNEKYADPRWYTINQIKKNGYRINRGERHTKVEYWSLYNFKEKKKVDLKWYNSLTQEERADIEKYISVISKFSLVFNGDQLTGIPEYEPPLPSEEKNVSECIDRMTRSMGIEVLTTGTHYAFYSPIQDHIEIPDTIYFKSERQLNTTLLHELAHATGHQTRLNRGFEEISFGSQTYAIEELRAEITSFFLGFEYGLEQNERHIENHSAYIQAWKKHIEEDPNLLFRVINDANKISNYLVDLDHHQLIKDQQIINEIVGIEINDFDDEMEI